MQSLNQVAKDVWIVKPAIISRNAETVSTNFFQKKEIPEESMLDYLAQKEFNEFVNLLEDAGINYILQENNDREAPDSLFPNNWISFHHDGTVVLYPMMAVNRRRERKINWLELFESHFKISRVLDLTFYEEEGRFLEGTGSIVFDHEQRIAFASLSPRTDEIVLRHLCDLLNYSICMFRSFNSNGEPLYHTNVMLHIGKTYIVVCTEAITDMHEREQLLNCLKKTNKKIIEIDFNQLDCFTGNMLQLVNEDGELITLLSASAFDALTDKQFENLLRHTRLLRVPIPQIESACGGSVRCMLTEIFLPAKF